MPRQTRICVAIDSRHAVAATIPKLAIAGADGFVIPLRASGSLGIADTILGIRSTEISMGRPFAVIGDFEGRFTGHEQILKIIDSGEADGLDFIAISCERAGDEIRCLRERIDAVGHPCRVIAKMDQAEDYDDVESLVKVADAVMMTESGLRSLPLSAAPITQKSVSRQCQIAAKPCLVARNFTHATESSDDPTLESVFDIANIAFDHIDGIVLRGDRSNANTESEFLSRISDILVAAEGYLEITDRPVRVGFGQPPHTASLAYAIRHILKMQEIAAIAVYSISGATARVIAKNWISCPILAFSSRPETARSMCLYHGVISRRVEEQLEPARLLETAGALARDLDIASLGDRIIVVSGHPDQANDQANGFVIEVIS